MIKNPSAKAGDLRDEGNPLRYSCLECPMDREAWRATVLGVSKSQTRLKWLSTQHRLCRQDFLSWKYLESVTNSSSQDQITYSSFHDQPYFSLFSLRLQERTLLHNLVKKIICVRTAYETNVWQKWKVSLKVKKASLKRFPLRKKTA